MIDPLGELKDSLAYLFELQSTENGRCIDPFVQELKNSLDKFQLNPQSIQSLGQAIKKALPILDKYVDSFRVLQKFEVLIGKKGETIRWYTMSKPQPQHMQTNIRTEGDFISWLSLKTGKDFEKLEEEKKIQVLTNQSEKNFQTKLGVYLRANPDFLANLALRSPNNFMQLITSRIGLQLEKYQIAKAIHHHGLALIADTEQKLQSHSFITFLNTKLASVGHSVEKLLDDPLAKAELNQSWFIRTVENKGSSFIRPN